MSSDLVEKAVRQAVTCAAGEDSEGRLEGSRRRKGVGFIRVCGRCQARRIVHLRGVGWRQRHFGTRGFGDLIMIHGVQGTSMVSPSGIELL